MYARAMAHTVCIAAICENHGIPLVVLCSDTQIEIDWLAKGRVRDKTSCIRPDCSVMFSGSLTKASELTGRYMEYVNSPEFSPNAFALEDALRKPLRTQQRIEIEDFVSAQRGMTFEKYLQLSESDKQVLLNSMQSSPSWGTCQLILIWFSGPSGPRLFSVTDRVAEEDQFCSIGCGANVAIASLMRRNYSSTMDIHEAIYCVYEAKRNSEVVPGVGQETLIYVADFDEANNRRLTVHPMHEHMTVLEKQYAAFGPRPFDRTEIDLLPGLFGSRSMGSS
jgi:20S proteasome alpha/beta subunit